MVERLSLSVIQNRMGGYKCHGMPNKFMDSRANGSLHHGLRKAEYEYNKILGESLIKKGGGRER
jgi:hypothetical protein